MRKKGSQAIVIVAFVLVVLFLLNPRQADFKAYLAAQASAQVDGKDSGGVIGSLSKGVAAAAGGIASFAGGVFTRKDYYLCSTYALGEKGSLYLGLAKRFFIKLR
jgi:hypothetical protein